MTNASKFASFAALSGLAVAVVLGLGSFATIAHADDFQSYDGGDFQSYSGGDFQSYGNDFQSYGNDYQPYANDYQPYSNDFQSYGNDYQPYSNDFQSYGNDFQSYGNDFQPYGNDFQSYGNDFQPYGNDFQAYGNDFQPYYDQQCGCDYTYQDGVGYSDRTYSEGGSVTSGGSVSTGAVSSSGGYGQTFTPPGVSAYPTSVARPVPIAQPIPVPVPQPYPQPIHQPIPQPIPPRPYPVPQPIPQPLPQPIPQPLPPQPLPPAPPINIYNNNTNTNIAPVVPIAQVPPQIPAVYTFPQAPIQNAACVITFANGLLSWASFGATYAEISNGVGPVPLSGTFPVNPAIGGNYVLTVTGPQGQVASCNTYVSIGNMPPEVSLTQIPYTGFDFGPAGNAIYWASLLAFALAAGYLMVYYRGGAFAFAADMFGSRRSYTSAPVKSQKTQKTIAQKFQAPVTKVASVIEKKFVAPVATSLNLPIVEHRRMTTDTMKTVAAHGTEAPRIIITRN